MLTGQMSQKARLLALTRFKSNEKNVLVATDVASRGLDIPSVDLVVNFDMPTAPKVHKNNREEKVVSCFIIIRIMFIVLDELLVLAELEMQ